jgi:dienelactone hydrolase
MNGLIVYNDKVQDRRPAVLVVHEWWGMNDYSKRRARELAKLGYVAMAVDMFGDGQTANNPDEAMKLAGPFYSDPQMGKQRLEAAIAKLKMDPHVDTTKIAAIGYCFGGSIVLNAAKLGTDLAGVVSFHGGLAGPAPDKNAIKAKFLVCHVQQMKWFLMRTVPGSGNKWIQ